MNIDFILTNPNPLDPASLCGCANAPSGTDLNALGLAHELSRRGHTIRVYGNFDGFTAPTYPIAYMHRYRISREGRYHRGTETPSADAVVAYHDGRALLEWESPVKIAMHQTYTLLDEHKGIAAEGADLYLSATARCTAHLKDKWGSDWRTLPNGWDYGAFQPHAPVPGRLIFHTDALRGLHGVLEALPAICQLVPHAHLHVYGVNLERLRGHQPTPEFNRRAEAIQRGLQANEGAVTLFPRVSRNEVLTAIASASCFAYTVDPPIPCEVFPMSVMDCMASGVPVVMVPGDGLERLFGEAVCYATKETFARRVVEVLRRDKDSRWLAHTQRCARDWIARHTFAAAADLLLEMIAEKAEEKRERGAA